MLKNLLLMKKFFNKINIKNKFKNFKKTLLKLNILIKKKLIKRKQSMLMDHLQNLACCN